DAVDVVLDVVPVLTPVPDVPQRTRDVVVHLVPAGDREPPLLQLRVRLRLRRRVEALTCADAVQRQGEWSRRGDARVLLPERSGRRVAWVREGRAALLDEARVELREVLGRDEHLAAHLEKSRDVLALQAIRHGREGPDVAGDVLAGAAVAARRPPHQSAI